MNPPKVQCEHTDRSAFFAGDMAILHAAIKTVGCRKQYDRRRRALGVPIQAADDVEAALEMRFGVDVERVQAIA